MDAVAELPRVQQPNLPSENGLNPELHFDRQTVVDTFNEVYESFKKDTLISKELTTKDPSSLIEVQKQQLIDFNIVTSGRKNLMGADAPLTIDTPESYVNNFTDPKTGQAFSEKEGIPVEGLLLFLDRKVETSKIMEFDFAPGSEDHKIASRMRERYERQRKILEASSQSYQQLHPTNNDLANDARKHQEAYWIYKDVLRLTPTQESDWKEGEKALARRRELILPVEPNTIPDILTPEYRPPYVHTPPPPRPDYRMPPIVTEPPRPPQPSTPPATPDGPAGIRFPTIPWKGIGRAIGIGGAVGAIGVAANHDTLQQPVPPPAIVQTAEQAGIVPNPIAARMPEVVVPNTYPAQAAEDASSGVNGQMPDSELPMTNTSGVSESQLSSSYPSAPVDDTLRADQVRAQTQQPESPPTQAPSSEGARGLGIPREELQQVTIGEGQTVRKIIENKLSLLDPQYPDLAASLLVFQSTMGNPNPDLVHPGETLTLPKDDHLKQIIQYVKEHGEDPDLPKFNQVAQADIQQAQSSAWGKVNKILGRTP